MIDNRPIQKLDYIESRLDKQDVLIATLQLNLEYALSMAKTDAIENNPNIKDTTVDPAQVNEDPVVVPEVPKETIEPETTTKLDETEIQK